MTAEVARVAALTHIAVTESLTVADLEVFWMETTARPAGWIVDVQFTTDEPREWEVFVPSNGEPSIIL